MRKGVACFGNTAIFSILVVRQRNMLCFGSLPVGLAESSIQEVVKLW